MVELTANRPNPLFLPGFSLPCCIPVPSQEEKCKELEWGWGKKWSGCISAEVYLAVAITPLESLKASFTNLQVGTAFPSLLFPFARGVDLHTVDKGLLGKLSESWPSFPSSTDVASKPVFSLVHSQQKNSWGSRQEKECKLFSRSRDWPRLR